MPLFTPDRGKPEAPAAGKQAEPRLDGWKEIAGHLDRGERTVKRWEADRGLPIYRVPGGGRASVFAFRNELTDWLRSNNVNDAELADSAPEAESTADRESKLPLELTEEDATPSASLSPEAVPHGIFSKPDIDEAPAIGLKQSHQRSRYALIFVSGLLLAGTVGLTASHIKWLARRVRPTGSSSVSSADKSLAHDLYLKGRFEWNKRTPDSLERALDDFTEAIVHDPTSARAYSGLSDTYVLMHEYSSLRTREAYTRAIAASKKAVQLDDSLAEAHRSLAFAEVWGSWDFADSAKQFRRAIELDPQDPLTHLWFATAFEGQPGWRAVVLQEFNRAQELDPSSPVILSNKGIWLFEVGERKTGFELESQVERDNPDFVAPHHYLAIMYWILRDYPDFLAESEKAASLKHDDALMEATHDARSGFRKNGEKGLLESLYLTRKRLDPQGNEGGRRLQRFAFALRNEMKRLSFSKLSSITARPRLEYL